MGRTKVGVLGATGAVGQRLVRLLNGHPWFEIVALAGSERTSGKRYGDVMRPAPAVAGTVEAAVLDMQLRCPEPDSFSQCAIVFSALPSDAAKEIEPLLAAGGIGVVSNASTYRMEEDVPLMVPEVNPDHLRLIEVQRRQRGWTGFLVTNPNCSTISLTLALAPLHRAFGLESAYVTTLQAISGAGFNGVSALDMVDNIVPYIGGEEDKIETEPLKLLGTLTEGQQNGSYIVPPQDLRLSAQCTRVPTTDGHMEMVSVKLRTPATHQEIVDAWESWRPAPQQLGLPSAPSRPVVVRTEPNRPQPRFDRDEEGGMATVVGRLRPCPLLDWKFALLGHNLVRGAAGGVLLIAELLKSKGYVD
ncbi:MAG TPA: aspartate-semialdehyde dehydrogenase [Chloroflexia bacterium]